jgi:hypothetical protein
MLRSDPIGTFIGFQIGFDHSALMPVSVPGVFWPLAPQRDSEGARKGAARFANVADKSAVRREADKVANTPTASVRPAEQMICQTSR